MSDELRLRLRMLEEDYEGQPVVVQQQDLLEIHRLRAELGMPPVDAKLREVVAAASMATNAAMQEPLAKDHSEARAIYEAYLEKSATLAVHRTYAERVVKATHGVGRTPVRPLATMGTGGGPLLCDECGKPIVLEGGRFHGMNADDAWARHPDPPDSWVSYILGGLVVELEANGTLRIYHGYLGRGDRECCNAASKKSALARQRFGAAPITRLRDRLLAFLADECPSLTKAERDSKFYDIVDVMYGYDPGLGLNRP